MIPGPASRIVAVRFRAFAAVMALTPCSGLTFSMNISKLEQRVLHALAQGGRIVHRRDDDGRIAAVDCFTREGYVLTDCTLSLFQRLRRRGLIASDAQRKPGAGITAAANAEVEYLLQRVGRVDARALLAAV